MFQISWTKKAEAQLRNTLLYWNEHNKSTSYSKKLAKEVNKKQDFLINNPNSGTPVNYNSVFKIQILKEFSLIYKMEKQNITIIAFWDNRRNPDNLEL